MSEVIEITDETFEKEVLSESMPTLVDFWATWCGPCRKLSPIVDELSAQFDGKIKFTKIKVDENTKTAQKYSIIGVPCILIFKNGEITERIVNILPKKTLEALLNKYI